MNCLLIDDNVKTATHLQELLTGVSGIRIVHKGVQPHLIRLLMPCEQIDVIFTRVRLWDYHAYEGLSQMPITVFLCGGKDKLTDQPGTVVPYKLREPYTVFELEQLMRKLRKNPVIESPDYFFVRYEGRFHRLFFRDIEMIERMRMSYVKIYTRYTSMLVSGTLTYWLSRLPEDKFVRVSDTLVLPLEQLNSIEGDRYVYRGRSIELTYRFAETTRREMEQHNDWSG